MGLGKARKPRFDLCEQVAAVSRKPLLRVHLVGFEHIVKVVGLGGAIDIDICGHDPGARTPVASAFEKIAIELYDAKGGPEKDAVAPQQRLLDLGGALFDERAHEFFVIQKS